MPRGLGATGRPPLRGKLAEHCISFYDCHGRNNFTFRQMKEIVKIASGIDLYPQALISMRQNRWIERIPKSRNLWRFTDVFIGEVTRLKEKEEQLAVASQYGYPSSHSGDIYRYTGER